MKNQNPIMRFLRHLFSIPSHVNCHFSPQGLDYIEQAIEYGETRHGGEIRFVVEAGLHPIDILTGKKPRPRALELFGRLNVWDTEANNGVLLYLLLADRDIEIVADRGIANRVSQDVWEAICDTMEVQFKAGEFETGVIKGIEAINAVLESHFPRSEANKNELSNRPLLM